VPREVRPGDAVISGCVNGETALRTMAELSPERIVYVSCNPATLARDIKYLRANGYELTRVRPVDNFPRTMHVETVVLMSRVAPYTHSKGANK